MSSFPCCSVSRPRALRSFACVLLSLATASHGHAADLSFDDAVRLALSAAQETTASSLREEAAELSAVPAGELPDPELVLGMDNLPVDGRDQFNVGRDFMTMRRIAISQTITSSALRAAEQAGARSEIALAHAESQRAMRTVLQQVADAWISRRGTERQISRVDVLVRENRLLADAVRIRHAAGRGNADDLLRPREEALTLADRSDMLHSQRAQATAALRRWLGAAADGTLVGDPPRWRVDADALRSRLPRHADLTALDARAGALDAAVDRARAAQYPNWGVEVAYQQRGPRFSDMVSLQVSVDLPLFGAHRQRPRIDASIAERNALDAEREAVLRERAAQLEAGLAELARLERACARQHELALPLAAERINLARVSWQDSSGTLAALIAARQAGIVAELATIALETERDRLAAVLHYTYADLGEAR